MNFDDIIDKYAGKKPEQKKAEAEPVADEPSVVFSRDVTDSLDESDQISRDAVFMFDDGLKQEQKEFIKATLAEAATELIGDEHPDNMRPYGADADPWYEKYHDC